MERKEKGGADEAVAFLRGGIELILEKKKLSELRPADYNPRKALTPEDAEYKKIKNSIERFGYVDPIIINSDGTIIGGHQRYTVLTDLGYEEAECVVVNLNKNDEKALNIALNKITGEWDNDKLNKYRTNANGSMQISNDELKDADFYSFLLAAFENANKCMRDGAAIYVFHADFHGRVSDRLLKMQI